jgi:polyhydroxyalkanoate synthesis repressor PhaR
MGIYAALRHVLRRNILRDCGAKRSYDNGAMRIVKKYSNRRLYDTDDSQYITLDELAELVRGGADVFIQDAKTGADLTQSTLAQVILESRGGGRLLPVPLLVQMIRMGDDALAEFLGRYMSWAMELYLHAKQGSNALFPMNPLAQLPFTASNVFARMIMGKNPFRERDPNERRALPREAFDDEPPPESTPPPPAPTHAEDVADLRRELEELKRSLRVGAKKRT